MKTINSLVDYLTMLLQNGGIIFGIILILLESVIPALPLGIFITLNINAFGLFLGLIISWLSTCFGCYMSFLLYRFLSNKFLNKYLYNNKKIRLIINKMKTIEFPNLVVLIALPFTPSFFINISCGIINMSKRKFLAAIFTGKIFMVLFWGCIGKSLLESVTDIKTIIIISMFILLAYLLSKIVSKKMNIE